jgi:hypothetical protein
MANWTEAEDRISEAVLKQLRAELDRAAVATVSILVDPTLNDPLWAGEYAEDAVKRGHVTRHDLPQFHDNFPVGSAPYLLHVPDEPQAERLVNESIRIAVAEALGSFGKEYKGRSSCAWIIGDTNPVARASRLARLARVVRPDRKSWPLRFWDPRVLWHLHRVLADDQFSAMIGCLGHWLQLGPDNALRSTTPPPLGNVSAAGLPLEFDQAKWSALARIGPINRVLELGWNWGILPNEANARRVDALIQKCHAHGFLSEQDELVFCSCALTCRDDFDTHPEVAQALDRGAREGVSAMQVLQTFDEAFWSALRLHPVPATA